MGVTQDFSDDKIIRMPDLDYTPDPRGLGYILHSAMKKYPNNIAQINGTTGEKDTYRSLLQRCTRLAIRMRLMGVTDEDIISICAFNYLNSCVPYLATLFLGAKISGLDPTLSVDDTAHLLRQINPKFVFVGPEALILIKESLAKIGSDAKVIVFGPEFDELLLPISEEDQFVPHEVKNLQETCIIFFSSGTTGLPKCICIHHYGFMSQLHNMLEAKFAQDIYFVFSSLYWVSVPSCLCSVILEGKIRLLVPRFDVDVVWKAIDKYKPTFITAVPFHFMSLYKGKPKDVNTSSLVHLLVGGGAIVESQIKIIQDMFPSAKIFTGYGQTELAVGVTIFKPSSPRDVELSKKKPTSSGTGIPGISYKVVDLDTEQLLGPHEMGQLLLKTKFHLSGYYKMDSSHLWDKDGWYKTGDLVYYDEDRCFYVVDRIKEFLKFQSWHISPAWIENILATHDQIANSLVIGIPHEIDENHLMALVVLKSKSAMITARDIEKFVEERVDDRKRLRGGVKIVDSIPLSTTGKIKRRDIRDMVLRGEL